MLHGCTPSASQLAGRQATCHGATHATALHSFSNSHLCNVLLQRSLQQLMHETRQHKKASHIKANLHGTCLLRSAPLSSEEAQNKFLPPQEPPPQQKNTHPFTTKMMRFATLPAVLRYRINGAPQSSGHCAPRLKTEAITATGNLPGPASLHHALHAIADSTNTPSHTRSQFCIKTSAKKCPPS